MSFSDMSSLRAEVAGFVREMLIMRMDSDNERDLKFQGQICAILGFTLSSHQH